MGKAFLCKSNGGGGGGLAFRVYGNPVPATPKPNDIWVDTDEKITSYIFSATEPEGYAEGMVWISTGTASTVEFNALKKNGITVCPLFAKQYVNGAWVDKEAKSYQGGAWVDWITYLIKDGNAGAYGFSTQLRTQCTFPITQHDGYINVQGYRDYVSAVLVDTKVDVSDISTIEMDIDAVKIGTIVDDFEAFTGMSLVLVNSVGCTSYNAAVSAVKAYKNTRVSGRQTLSLDVSSMSGEFYVGIALGGYASGSTSNVASVNLYNIRYY